MFLPVAFRDFMLGHPLWGWAGMVGLLIAYRPIIRWHFRTIETRQSKMWGKKVVALSGTWSAMSIKLASEYAQKKAELSRSDRERDLPLLQERLVGWELNGDLHKFLARDVSHYLLQSDFVYELERRVDQWRRDPRELTDADISTVWDNFVAAARGYADKISEYMWENDKADFLQLPPEWKHTDHELYKKAFNELEERRNAFLGALTDVYKIQHTKISAASPDR